MELRIIQIYIILLIYVEIISISEIGDDEFMKCWSLDNLQPMWGKENQINYFIKTLIDFEMTSVSPIEKAPFLCADLTASIK